MPKGKHKGGKRHFTNFDEETKQKEKEEKEKAWRIARGLEITDEEESGSGEEEESGSESESEEESGGEEEEGKIAKPKGTEGLIEIENPNYIKPVTKKVTSLTLEPTAEGAEKKVSTDPTQLSRKQREEVDKQRADAHYRKLHSQGKTDEAKADLERLALIRKQREETQQKKDEEKRAKEAAAAAKRDSTAKAMNKKGKSKS